MSRGPYGSWQPSFVEPAPQSIVRNAVPPANVFGVHPGDVQQRLAQLVEFGLELFDCHGWLCCNRHARFTAANFSFRPRRPSLTRSVSSERIPQRTPALRASHRTAKAVAILRTRTPGVSAAQAMAPVACEAQGRGNLSFDIHDGDGRARVKSNDSLVRWETPARPKVSGKVAG